MFKVLLALVPGRWDTQRWLPVPLPPRQRCFGPASSSSDEEALEGFEYNLSSLYDWSETEELGMGCPCWHMSAVSSGLLFGAWFNNCSWGAYRF